MQFTIANTLHTTAANSRRNAFTSPTVRLWTAQALLASLFVFAGAMKFAMSAEDLTKGTDITAGFLRFIGACEVLGGIGLVAPGIFSIRRELTSLAAAGLVVIMAGATALTIAAGDYALALYPFIVGLLAAYVAVRRSNELRRN